LTRSSAAGSAAQTAAAGLGGIQNIIEIGNVTHLPAIRILFDFAAFGVGLILPFGQLRDSKDDSGSEHYDDTAD
jgi:hypothetical protein